MSLSSVIISCGAGLIALTGLAFAGSAARFGAETKDKEVEGNIRLEVSVWFFIVAGLALASSIGLDIGIAGKLFCCV